MKNATCHICVKNESRDLKLKTLISCRILHLTSIFKQICLVLLIFADCEALTNEQILPSQHDLDISFATKS